MASSALPVASTRVKDPAASRHLVEHSCESFAEIVIQLNGQTQKFSARLLDNYDYPNSFAASLPESTTPTELKNYLTQSKTSEVLIIVFLQGQFLLGIVSEIQKFSAKGIVFAWPERVLKIQRRREPRFSIPVGYDYSIETDPTSGKEAREKCKILDLSAGGVGFFVSSKIGIEKYPIGKRLNRVWLSIRGKKMMVDLMVRNHVKIKSHVHGALTGYKVGTEFVKITSDNQNALREFVFDNVAHLVR